MKSKEVLITFKIPNADWEKIKSKYGNTKGLQKHIIENIAGGNI